MRGFIDKNASKSGSLCGMAAQAMLGMNIIMAVAVLLIAPAFLASDYIHLQAMCDVLVSVGPGAYSHITQTCGASLLSFRRDGACPRD
jgi:hypothetical protein